MSPAVLLAGCTAGAGTPEALVRPSPSQSAPPTLAPPVGAPAKPAEWPDTGEGGAAAAAVWFLSEEYRYVIETNDTTEWQRLSTDDCEFCANVASDADDVRASGYSSRQSDPNRVTVTRVEEANPLVYSVLVDITEAPVTDFTPEGEWYRESEPVRGQVLVVLYREGPDWVLRAAQWFGAGESVPIGEEAS